MANDWQTVPFGKFLVQRKESVTIEDFTRYKRTRAQLHGKGVVLRDEVLGSEVKTKSQQLARTGEFLVAEIDAKVGGFGIVPTELDGAIVSSHYFLFQINEQSCCRAWLDWFVRSGMLEDQVKAQGSTNYAAIRPDDVLDYQIPLPLLAEQQRIVARVDAMARCVEEARGLRRAAVEEAEAVMDSAVGVAFGKINVEPRPLATLASKIGSGSTPKGGRSNYPSSGIPFIRSLNVRMRQFAWDGIAYIDSETQRTMSGTQVMPNDVLLNITGASIGRVACAPLDLAQANVNQHVTIIRPLEMLEPRYLMYWLSQPTVQDIINDKQKGATRQGFTKSQIEQFEVPVPPLADQRRIVAYLDGLQAKVDELRCLQAATQKELDALMPSILAKEFAGEL